ncbi:MAG: hypothetical protein ABS37_20210 [Acidovorax sp. SCN 65-108]|nr:MAG: hypothetical protein ABS37_20210 [Acidovorax sp. SCN 65-108]OJV69632.1 MAG: hypothetical protein BGO35_11435 [Burkholderiales bacterium 64-34]
MNYLLVVQVFVRTPGGLGLRGNQHTLLDLRRIGLGLLQLVSMRVYMDGGTSLQHIVDDAQVLVNELKASVEEFPRFDR